MTMLTLDARIGKLALIAAAVAIALIAFGAPAVADAAGAAQTERPRTYTGPASSASSGCS